MKVIIVDGDEKPQLFLLSSRAKQLMRIKFDELQERPLRSVVALHVVVQGVVGRGKLLHFDYDDLMKMFDDEHFVLVLVENDDDLEDDLFFSTHWKSSS